MRLAVALDLGHLVERLPPLRASRHSRGRAASSPSKSSRSRTSCRSTGCRCAGWPAPRRRSCPHSPAIHCPEVLGDPTRCRTCENGTIWSALSLPSRKITLRCRLLPAASEVHSKPMKAVKPPRLVVLLGRAGDLPPHGWASSGVLRRIIARVHPPDPVVESLGNRLGVPFLTRSCLHPPPFGLAGSIRIDSTIAGARPRFSAWSEITRKSSGRASRAGAPVLDVTSRRARNGRLLPDRGYADHAGIGRIRGVQVRVAKQHPVGEALLGIRRVRPGTLRDKRIVEWACAATARNSDPAQSSHAAREIVVM